MNHKTLNFQFEGLETRRLMSWSSYRGLSIRTTPPRISPTSPVQGVTVAVIDTGIDYTQPSLGGGFGKNFKVVGGYDFFDNDSDPMDETGHGTNVAGVIAAKPYTVNGVTYQGVAPDAKLVALRVGTDDEHPRLATSRRPFSGSSITTRPTASRS